MRAVVTEKFWKNLKLSKYSNKSAPCHTSLIRSSFNQTCVENFGKFFINPQSSETRANTNITWLGGILSCNTKIGFLSQVFNTNLVSGKFSRKNGGPNSNYDAICFTVIGGVLEESKLCALAYCRYPEQQDLDCQQKLWSFANCELLVQTLPRRISTDWKASASRFKTSELFSMEIKIKHKNGRLEGMCIMFVALFLTALFLKSEGKNTLFGHDMYYALDFLVLRIFEKLV